VGGITEIEPIAAGTAIRQLKSLREQYGEGRWSKLKGIGMVRLPVESAAQSGFLRVIDDSGEDYLYPADNFLRIELPRAVEDALAALAS
jgi:hypothetical protein